jgi:uncharacterized membrane protein
VTREGSHRVIFIDLARALAVVMMVYGHAVSALLAPAYRTGAWYDAWTFQRGLTSSLFLLLSGFAFSVATTRHWATHLHPGATVWRRLRRFALFVALGYALHLPVGRLVELASASDAQWRSFLAVDVLQLIGVTFIAIQALVFVVRSRRVFTGTALALAVGVIAATPALWSVDWSTTAPPAAAAYLSQATGSQFPLFPWSAFVLIGAGAGQIYARWGAGHLSTFATGFIAAGVAVALVSAAPIFGSGSLNWVPELIVLRTGICFVILGLIAHASRVITRLPHAFAAVAQESLLIYFVHLCIVYGSVWNRGLTYAYAEALSAAATTGVVIVLLAAMVALAWQWNRLKHVAPRTARWVSVATGVVMGASLL